MLLTHVLCARVYVLAICTLVVKLNRLVDVRVVLSCDTVPRECWWGIVPSHCGYHVARVACTAARAIPCAYTPALAVRLTRPDRAVEAGSALSQRHTRCRAVLPWHYNGLMYVCVYTACTLHAHAALRRLRLVVFLNMIASTLALFGRSGGWASGCER